MSRRPHPIILSRREFWGPSLMASSTRPTVALVLDGGARAPRSGGMNVHTIARLPAPCLVRGAHRMLTLQELMRKIRHHTISDQVGELNAVLRGHYAYYGVAGNIRALFKVYR